MITTTTNKNKFPFVKILVILKQYKNHIADNYKIKF